MHVLNASVLTETHEGDADVELTMIDNKLRTLRDMKNTSSDLKMLQRDYTCKTNVVVAKIGLDNMPKDEHPSYLNADNVLKDKVR